MSKPLTEEALAATIAACKKWDRLCAAAPEMAELLRRIHKDGYDELWRIHEDVTAMLKRLDGE
jgi:hypothetical protein